MIKYLVIIILDHTNFSLTPFAFHRRSFSSVRVPRSFFTENCFQSVLHICIVNKIHRQYLEKDSLEHHKLCYDLNMLSIF